MGLLTLVIALALLPIVVMFVLMIYGWIHPLPEGQSVGWDPISLVKQSPLLPAVIVVIVFTLALGVPSAHT